MNDAADNELLCQYADRGSEEAFATLVARYVNLVYSVALRKTGQSQAAEEVTQAVFLLLARKAPALRHATSLSGWLYQATRLTASTFLRTETRRSHREQQAYMESKLNQVESETWQQIAPMLEDAMGGLGEKERHALVLRFFEQKSFLEIGATVGASENAAKKRVGYALEKLRRYFARRGVSSATAILATVIASNSVQAAPAALTKSVTALAIGKGVAVSTSTLTLTKGVLKIMAWTKAKMAVAIGVGALLATGVTTITVPQLSKQLEAYRTEDWQKGWHGAAMVERVPAQTTIRPAPASRPASVQDFGSMGEKAIGLGNKLDEMVAMIYGTEKAHLIVLAPLPEGKFDCLATKPNCSYTSELRGEIRRQFGLSIRRQFVETNALILTLRNRLAPGLRPTSDASYQEGPKLAEKSLSCHGGIWLVVRGLERSLGAIVVDKTGLSDLFDIDLQWDGTQEGLKKALLDKLGMELVPGPAIVEMKVVEKAVPTKNSILRQNSVADIQADGSIRYQLTAEDINRTGKPLLKDYIGEDLPVERITDGAGQPMAFTNCQGVIVMTLNQPVPPGEKYSLTIEVTIPHWARPTDNAGEFEWQLQTVLYDDFDARSIEEYRLPPGAVLLTKNPADMKQSTRNGQLVLQTERTIPMGVIRVADLRYRLAQ